MSFLGNPRLPYDILLEVIHHLDANHDVTTLRSLSTTCHTLCAPCQCRLFSSITIDGNANVYDYLLGDLLLASPHLASYIRYLDYHCSRDNESCLETALNQISVANIEVLKISSRRGVKLGIGLNRALSRIFRSPSIRRLQLHGITNPPWFTTDAPNLTDLVLDVDSEAKGVQPVTLGLKSLTVAWNCAWISNQLKLVLRSSPLLRNLRCYGKYILHVSCARVLVTHVVLGSSFRWVQFWLPCEFNNRRKFD